MDGRVMSELSGPGVVVAGVAIVLGLVICFWGCRLIRVVLTVCGFLLGAALGALLAGLLGAEGDVPWIAALIGGLLGAALSATLYKFGIFLVGASAGAVLGGMIGVNLEGAGPLIAILLAAVLVGILAVIGERIVVILATAFGGSWLAVRAAAALLVGGSMAWDDLLGGPFAPQLAGMALLGFLAAWSLLGIAGALVQFRSKK